MNPTITIALMLAATSLIISIATIWLYLKQQRFFTSLTQGLSKQNLKSILKQLAAHINQLDQQISEHQTLITNLTDQGQSHFQKVGFIRFNPFSDTGGDQSFSLCLLDDNLNGIMITSLHSREQTRLYAKQIKNGQSHQQKELFQEEKEALKLAITS